VEAAEARLKGLFATSPGYATAAAPVVAHMPVREHLGKPGSKELLGGVQGKRVAVEVGRKGVCLKEGLCAQLASVCFPKVTVACTSMCSAWRAAGHST
jgi:hypothetical protein